LLIPCNHAEGKTFLMTKERHNESLRTVGTRNTVLAFCALSSLLSPKKFLKTRF
jgi:hypothetical protein